MARIHAWHLWPARNWPANAAEEAAFVADLEERATGHRRPADRPHITAVMNALRCGVPVDDLLRFLPGTRPEDLLSAYLHVEARRHVSEQAWLCIEQAPTVEAITEHAPVASRLAPVPVAWLATTCTFVGEGSLAKLVAKVTASMQEMRLQAEAIENDLGTFAPPSLAAVELARTLYDPYTPGLWAHPYYMPPRVGCLTPVRLSDVLGERHR